jgi:hypothetical protein
MKHIPVIGPPIGQEVLDRCAAANRLPALQLVKRRVAVGADLNDHNWEWQLLAAGFDRNLPTVGQDIIIINMLRIQKKSEVTSFDRNLPTGEKISFDRKLRPGVFGGCEAKPI